MAYATVSDVNALLATKGQITSSTVPTDTQVTAWIAEYEAELNGLLVAAGFTAGEGELLRRALSHKHAAIRSSSNTCAASRVT